MEEKQDKRFLILVPTVSLVTQYTNTFHSYDAEVTTYQSLLWRTPDELLALYGNIDYIVCDECHHLGDNVWGTGVNNFINLLEGVKVLGLTATPVRGDSIDVVKTFFNNVQVTSMDLLEGIQHQFIPKIKYVVAYCGLRDVDDRRMLEIDRYGLEKLLNVSGVIKKHIDKAKISKNMKIIVYVSRLKNIRSTMKQCKKWFSEAFPDKNINTYFQHSLESQKVNERQLELFSQQRDSKHIDIIVSVDMLSEGVHIPEVSTVIMFRRTKSPVVYFQQIGRTINTDEPLIFDLVDNGERLRIYHKIYEMKENRINWTGEYRDKKLMFNDCIDLIDETKYIEEILDTYRKCSMQTEHYIKTVAEIESKLDMIKELIGRGLSIIKISETLNLNYLILRRYFREHELRTKYARHTSTAKYKINGIIKRNINKLSTREITKKELCEKAGCQIDYLYEYLQKHNPELVQTQNKKSGLTDAEKEYVKQKMSADTYIDLHNEFKDRDTTFFIKKYAQRIGLKPSEIQKANTVKIKNQILDYYKTSVDPNAFNNDMEIIKAYLQQKFNTSRNMVDTALRGA
jgi:superfamily II DNA/RNA helicase